MSKLFKNLVKVTPLVLGASVAAAGSAVAQTMPGTPQLKIDPAAQQQLDRIQRAQNSQQINTGVYQGSMSQVTSVNQLRDVSPTAWAYEALRSLVERYGCIVGFPDRTFRGDRATTRWEFAAGLNACLNVMERLIQDGVAVLREDIDKLKRLVAEFETELAALGARVDNLEQRVAFLENNQFSTTTKLRGEVIFSIADSWGGQASITNTNGTVTDGSNQDETQTVFNNRVRLNFETSFTGKDLLRTRLQAGNFNNTFNQNGPTVTNMTRLAYDDGRDNDVTIDDLFYRAPIGTPFGNITIWVGANQLNLDDVFITANPFLADSGTGALSRGQRYNNIVFRGPSGVGAGVRFNIGDVFQVTGTYLADGGTNGASNPNPGSGLFNGSYSAGAQVGFSFIKFADINFVYVRSYQTAASMSSGLFGNVSSPLTERPFGNVATVADRFGLQASAQVIPGVLNLAGWAGYANASATGVNDAIGDNNTGIWSWNLNLSVLDLFAEGAALSLGGGQVPRSDKEDSTSYMVEAQYKFPVTKNILITPGAYAIFNANNRNNDTIFVGVIRTTFRF
ncbi:MAG: carbohydrate porin [Microcystis sp. M038S2]|uniref:iron uptake porin n=1 Tax=unclassified Microcystis TaxID=2643300 RepID=UPI002590A78A|nr:MULTISPECIES: iron uptake porin [unclassified Microcystis]MCA2685913.1 carbohydrate porin [Microcystis sp. M046S2]MCA2706354.1 carbohydrate porin [Microcystis sp. M038S2]MCA2946387.1 carbohydrate porin [Microcystis sp. M109S1]MCA2950957.1 carbohydrate porin [Microcystis sp. M112S1]